MVVGAGPNGLVAANMLADAGWDVLVLAYRDGFEGYVAEFGADVVVLDPPRLRDAVVRNLRALSGHGVVPGPRVGGQDEADLRMEWETAS